MTLSWRASSTDTGGPDDRIPRVVRRSVAQHDPGTRVARPRALAGPIARLPLPWAAVDPRDDSVGAALRSPAEGSLDEAQHQATGDMPPAERRAALHAAADLVADYLQEVETYAVLPAVQPGELRDRLDGPPPEEPVASRGDPAGRAQRGHPERHALAASRLLRLLPGQRLDHRPARRARLERSQCQCLPVAHVACGRRARGHHGRLAARRPGPAGRASTASSTTRPRSAAWRLWPPPASMPPATPRRQASRGSAPLRDLHLGGGPLLDRTGGHDPGPRPGRRPQGPGRRRAGHGPGRRSGRPSARIGRRAGCRLASWPPSARPRRRPSTRSAPSPTSAAEEDIWLHVDAAYAGPAALIPDDAPPLRRLGARRLDRRQPAQVAVHALRLLAPADASDGDVLRDALSLVPEYLRTTDGRDSRSRLQRVHPAARPAGTRHQDVDAAALLRAVRPAGHGSRRTSTWPRSWPPGSTPSPMPSSWRRCPSASSASAGVRPASRVGRRSPRSPPRSTR